MDIFEQIKENECILGECSKKCSINNCDKKIKLSDLYIVHRSETIEKIENNNGEMKIKHLELLDEDFSIYCQKGNKEIIDEKIKDNIIDFYYWLTFLNKKNIKNYCLCRIEWLIKEYLLFIIIKRRRFYENKNIQFI